MIYLKQCNYQLHCFFFLPKSIIMKSISFLFFLVPVVLYGQTKVTHIDLKKVTLNWFKEIYVKDSWKDPYSYKLVNCTLTPISFQKYLDNASKEIDFELDKVDTTKRSGVYNTAKWNTIVKKKNYDDDLLGLDSSKVYFSKIEYNKAVIQQETLIKIYQNLVNKRVEIDSLKSTSSRALLEMPYRFNVIVDAYGKNGNGNLILGRYYYLIDTTGKTIGEVSYK